jgi:hypothetical protein
MNRLNIMQRSQVIAALVEGTSVNATVRMTGVAKHTILKLLKDIGCVCAEYHNRIVRNVNARRAQCDEIWAFCYAKEKNLPEELRGKLGYGDVWTWTAIDADSKLHSVLHYRHWRIVNGARFHAGLVWPPMRRFTRLTNGFSKKAENHGHAVALHFFHYNFIRIHKTLRVTPAMEAGIADHIWSFEELVALLDVREKQVA